MIHGAYPASALPSIGYAMSGFRAGKMSVPVAPYNYIYSHFEHVSGVRAPEGARGVAINKLKVLDVLIERLSQLKKQGVPKLDTAASDDRIDAMIEQYQSQIRQAASAVVPYRSAPTIAPGAVFSLVA